MRNENKTRNEEIKERVGEMGREKKRERYIIGGYVFLSSYFFFYVVSDILLDLPP